jgi:hypothetical protein
MSCISRRAHADRYSFRLFKEENGEVKEKNYIWTEYRCPNEVLNGKDVCIECSVKNKDHRFQSAPKFDHGIIGGIYTSQSKLYGSEYYLKLLKNGWKIKEEDERRAKEAQQKANMAPRKAKVDDNGVALNIKTTTSKTESTPKASPTPRVSSSTSLTSLATPKTPRKPRVAKKAVLPEANLTPAQFVETMELPTIISEVIIVKVKKIRCAGSEYYYDSNSGKLYGVSTKGVGAYKGRYNSQDQTVNTSYPDSDDE